MRWVIGIATLAVLGYLATGLTQVHPGERAVVRRFGRVIAVPEPGLWIGLPWGMDRVDRVPVDLVRRVTVGYRPEAEESGDEVPPGQLLTGDHNLVNIQVALQYSVDRVVPFLEQRERADEMLGRAAESVLEEWIAGRGIDDVLLHGKSALPGRLVADTQQRIASYELGIRVQSADVVLLQPPREVQDAFADVNRAQTAMRTREHEARQEAARLLRQAEIDRYRLERQTEAYVTERLQLARAEAERFDCRLEQYHQLRGRNPNVLAAIWWEEMGKLLSRLRENSRVDLLDQHLGRDGLDINLFPPLPRKK